MEAYKICGFVKSNIVPIKRSLSWLCKRYYHTSVKQQKNKFHQFQPVSDLFTNPVDRLQPLSRVPLINESERIFNPSRSEIEEASQMFEHINVKGRKFEFLGSWPNPYIMPQWKTPEVAIIGKSNVGKSSLLAAMFAQIPEITVKCSSKPGHTKLMNVFQVGSLFNLVDMPGYGFNMPDHFETSVEAYIKSRRSLLRVFFLIDGAHGPAPVDMIGIEMMEETSTPYVDTRPVLKCVMNVILFDGSVGMTRNDQKYLKRYSLLNLPLTIVLTKIDKARPAKLMQNILSVMKFKEEVGAHSCFPQPFLVSSMNGEGLAYLQSFIAYITGNLTIQALSSEMKTE